MTKSNFLLLVCLLLTFQTLTQNTSCPPGEVKCVTGLCEAANYIEGCLIYKSKS